MWCPEEVKYAYHDYMALQANAFWKDPAKAKPSTDQRNFGGKRNDGPRVRTCYNCGDKYHFVVDCNYERREDHNGKLVPKDKTKLTKKREPLSRKSSHPRGNQRLWFSPKKRNTLPEKKKKMRMMTPQVK